MQLYHIAQQSVPLKEHMYANRNTEAFHCLLKSEVHFKEQLLAHQQLSGVTMPAMARPGDTYVRLRSV